MTQNFDKAVQDLTLIAGQKAVKTKSKSNIWF